MPTVESYDQKIEELKSKLARAEERRKALIAKEREQEKKWGAGAITAIGELVLREVGCDWYNIDLECLQAWLSERAEDAHGSIVIEGQTPADAKRALDQFRRAQRRPRAPKGTDDAEGPEPEPTLDSDGNQTTQNNLW